MRRVLTGLALLPLAGLQLACDPIYGISRTARLPALPRLDCVERAIASVPSVSNVRHWVEEGSRPVTLTGIQRPDRLYRFAYESGTTDVSIHFSENYKGEIEYSQHFFGVGLPIPQEQIDAVRPVMLQVEAALEQQCGIERLPEQIEEICSGVECE